ncbi:MAG: DUF3467 domain-containing protein [bacterium]|nr:DUF3467 domain-containing protein [bacterium]
MPTKTQEEEFIPDFVSRVGGQRTVLSRIFLSPTHAQRLVDLLKRQVARHKKTFGGGTSKRRRKKP